ncbi:MAG: helix-turn-helix domain-containing protein [Actinomycetes bacterium]
MSAQQNVPSGTTAGSTTSTKLIPRAARGSSDDCRVIRETLDRVGDKWTLLVIMELSAGPLRFNALKSVVEGISQRMLTLTVRKLERDGLVLRTVFPEIPPHVEYSLTPLGHTLIGPVTALAAWALDHHDRIEANRIRFDADRTAGAATVS